MRSLRKQLTFWLIALMTLVGVLGGGLSYHRALTEANRLLDHQLIRIAQSIDEGSQLPVMREKYRRENSEEKQMDFVIQVWMNGQPGRSSRPDFNLPERHVAGLTDVNWHGSQWRVYTMIHSNRTVQVSQSEEVRVLFASNTARRVLYPIGALIPLSWLLISLVVRHLLRPLEAVTEEVVQRDAAALDPLPVTDIPHEISPLIDAMNALMTRLDQAMKFQRKFLADAAHELRTPLAALQLQIENLQHGEPGSETNTRIEEMRRGVLRATRLVNQLLRIARLEAQTKTVPRKAIELDALVKTCIADFIPLANRRRIDLGLVQSETAVVVGNADDVRTLIGNLLDNAIRYTPEGGRVDISLCTAGLQAIFCIADNGPGIPEAALPQVFERFFRAAGQETEGSGIGLAIVKTICERDGIGVKLANRARGSGLLATLVFELALIPGKKPELPPPPASALG